MATAEEYQCFFKKSESEVILFTTVKEKSMNKYTITAREINTCYYEVEATNPDYAINAVEWGNVEPYDRDFEELAEVELTDVEYCEQMYTASLSLSFNAKGVEEEQVRDMLPYLLDRFEGQTTENCDGGTLKAIGFDIVDIQEA